MSKIYNGPEIDKEYLEFWVPFRIEDEYCCMIYTNVDDIKEAILSAAKSITRGQKFKDLDELDLQGSDLTEYMLDKNPVVYIRGKNVRKNVEKWYKKHYPSKLNKLGEISIT